LNGEPRDLAEADRGVRRADDPQPVAELTQGVQPGSPEADSGSARADDPQPVVEPTPTVRVVERRRRRDFAGAAVAAGRDVAGFVRSNSGRICLVATLVGIAVWATIFATLGVRNHRNFGTWAFDMAIYDQAFWLVAQGGPTFITVRGLDVWGHHVNLIAYLFAPFYRLGAGPEFLYVVQNVTIAFGALPVYLIAKERFGKPLLGLVFAVAYLLYAPAQWVSWINFHPEALVITPFLFAWYFSLRRWRRLYFATVFVVLIMREDAALAVMMMGVVLLLTDRRSATRRADVHSAVATIAVGFVWYLLATQVVIPHFNNGEPPFYMSWFFAHYGGGLAGIVETILRHPDRLVSDATQPDRIRFYRDLTLPLGGLSLLSPVHLLMAAPTMLASIIGSSPFARQIRYQYTSVMIAPIVIASIEGARYLWRFARLRVVIAVWLLACAYVTNVAWSPSPIGNGYGVWRRGDVHSEALRDAVATVPEDASVSSSFNLGPHLSRRRESYDWPNPFWPAFWGQSGTDCGQFPSASEIEYIALDLTFYQGDGALYPGESEFIDSLIAEDGEFDVIFNEDNVIVARRVKPGPDGVPLPPNCPGVNPLAPPG
jgi:uncharacterized membrane protein